MPDEPTPPMGEIVLYQTEDGRTRLECRFADETLWLSQALIAELFQVTPQNITLHLQTLYQEGEISEPSTCKEFLQVRTEGTRQVTRSVKYYSLNAILSVGYRVRSERGTQFRRWATERLKEYLVKGFTMDDQRLKNPPLKGLEPYALNQYFPCIPCLPWLPTTSRLYHGILGNEPPRGRWKTRPGTCPINRSGRGLNHETSF